ncbi:MAG: hypothetical protein GY827_09480 [Cytophagales bacterium]|nr:hypothetical protein [Cytophagales bacterium]
MNDFRFRFRWSTVLGVLSFGILVPTFFIPMELGSKAHFLSILVAMATSFVIWEGSKVVQKLVTIYFPWDQSIIRHLVFEILLIFIFSALGLLIGIFTYSKLVSALDITLSVVLQNIFVSFSLALLFTAINEGAFLFGKWKESLVQQEKLKEENLKAKLEGLKKQLDPHFLFNSLSVLSGVVYQDPILADRFITQLSKVYRYVLDSQNESLVSLKDEMKFVNAYFFLLKVRLENKIELENYIEDMDSIKVAPLAIQLLIENAIKHNQALEDSPLLMKVWIENHYLWVQNNLQLRKENTTSSKVGIKNLQDRYSYLSKNEIKVVQESQFFKVGIPLI